MSFKVKLTLILLTISLIPALFITALTFTDFKNSLEKNRVSALQDIVNFKADKIESVFRVIKGNMEMAQSFWNIKKNLPTLIEFAHDSNNPQFIAAKKTLDGQLQPMQKILDLDDIMLLNPEGKIVYSSNESHISAEFLNPIFDPTKKAVEEGKSKIYLTDLFATKEKSNEPNMLITAPVLDHNGVLIGLIAFDVNMTPIYKLIEERAGLGNTGETLIGKKAGNDVVYLNPLRFNPDAALKIKIPLGSPRALPTQEAAQGRKGAGLSIDYRNKEVIAAWQYIPLLDWGVVGKIDVSEAFADVTSLRNLVFIILVIVFFLVGIMAFSIAKSVSDPVTRLTEGTKIIGGGNLEYKIEPKTRDEIGQLGVAFNQMADKLKESQEKLVRSEKLAIVGKLSSSIAHELRNPLGVIKNVVYFLNMLELSKGNPEIKENLDIVAKEIETSDKIIGDLLEFSRPKKSVLHKESINSIVKEALDRIRIDPAVEVGLELRDDLPPVEVDALQMHQVFYNITRNALESMSGKGILKIRTGAKDDFVEVSFSDTGEGIPKENLAKIFEPLFSTKTKGTGLGLSICESLIKGHGGMIVVESEVGKGTTFTVKLPVKRG